MTSVGVIPYAGEAGTVTFRALRRYGRGRRQEEATGDGHPTRAASRTAEALDKLMLALSKDLDDQVGDWLFDPDLLGKAPADLTRWRRYHY